MCYDRPHVVFGVSSVTLVMFSLHALSVKRSSSDVCYGNQYTLIVGVLITISSQLIKNKVFLETKVMR